MDSLVIISFYYEIFLNMDNEKQIMNHRLATTNSQLKDGYKQTEIGVIPENWEVKHLKQISPSQSVGLVINPSSYFDNAGSVPMLVGSHVKENYIAWESANRISEFSNNLLPASRLAAGDLITVRVGDPGVTAVVPTELDGCNCASMMIVRQHRSFVSRWLCYVMNSPLGRSQIEHVQYGTAQKQFNISDAVDFLYPVPPLNEQEAIAHALSDIDALIESLDRLLTKKRQIKQGAMQELLRSKDEWDIQTIDDIGYVDPDNLDSKTAPGYEFKYISLEQVDKGFLTGWTEQVFSTSPSRARRKIKRDDILISTVRPNLQSHCLIKNEVSDMVCSTGFAVIRCRNGIAAPYYVFSHFFASFIERQIEALITGSNYPAINSSDVRKLKIPLPSFAKQIEIATILSDMDAEIDSIEAKLTKTRQIKQGMMHELLTGRIRLV
jgi:type I restriction enzyme, S subunit